MPKQEKIIQRLYLPEDFPTQYPADFMNDVTKRICIDVDGKSGEERKALLTEILTFEPPAAECKPHPIELRGRTARLAKKLADEAGIEIHRFVAALIMYDIKRPRD